MKSPFLEALEQRVLLADGALGTMLIARGLAPNGCIDAANLDSPELVRQVHEDYIAAGADIVQTNTFGGNRARLARHGLEGRVRDINFRAVRIARDAREIQGQPVFIAGSVGPTGLRLTLDDHDALARARDAFGEQIEALLEGGVDLLVLETFGSLAELGVAIEAARARTSLPIVAQMSFQEDGRTLAGESPADVAATVLRLGADVAGVNCGVGPQGAVSVVEQMALAGVPAISAQPNAGLPRVVEGRAHYSATPEYFAESACGSSRRARGSSAAAAAPPPSTLRAMRAAIGADGRDGGRDAHRRRCSRRWRRRAAMRPKRRSARTTASRGRCARSSPPAASSSRSRSTRRAASTRARRSRVRGCCTTRAPTASTSATARWRACG